MQALAGGGRASGAGLSSSEPPPGPSVWPHTAHSASPGLHTLCSPYRVCCVHPSQERPSGGRWWMRGRQPTVWIQILESRARASPGLLQVARGQPCWEGWVWRGGEASAGNREYFLELWGRRPVPSSLNPSMPRLGTDLGASSHPTALRCFGETGGTFYPWIAQRQGLQRRPWGALQGGGGGKESLRYLRLVIFSGNRTEVTSHVLPSLPSWGGETTLQSR